MEMLLFYVLIIMLFALIPEILDIILAYHSQNKTRKSLIEKASTDGLTLDELKEFIIECGKAPPGIQGLTRGLIALTVILILGISTLYILIKGAPAADSQIISNILSMLAGLLAAITGFYFGGRSAETILTESPSSTPTQSKPKGGVIKPLHTVKTKRGIIKPLHTVKTKRGIIKPLHTVKTKRGR